MFLELSRRVRRLLALALTGTLLCSVFVFGTRYIREQLLPEKIAI
jgi:hypothetical protein